MSHAFFRGVDWDDVYHKRSPPPFIPTVKGRADTSNFDSEFTSVTPVLTPVQSGEFYVASTVEIVMHLLIFRHSAVASYARGVQRVLVLGGLCLSALSLELHTFVTTIPTRVVFLDAAAHALFDSLDSGSWTAKGKLTCDTQWTERQAYLLARRRWRVDSQLLGAARGTCMHEVRSNDLPVRGGMRESTA